MRKWVRSHKEVCDITPVMTILGTLLPGVNTYVIIVFFMDYLFSNGNIQMCIRWIYNKFYNF